jgi:uncharacterized membrane protein
LESDEDIQTLTPESFTALIMVVVFTIIYTAGFFYSAKLWPSQVSYQINLLLLIGLMPLLGLSLYLDLKK